MILPLSWMSSGLSLKVCRPQRSLVWILTSIGGKGDILFTSRYRGLGELGYIIDILPMPDKAGVELLLHRYTGIDVNDYISEGSIIVRRLGGLALAID
jgi:hypothetical protein